MSDRLTRKVIDPNNPGSLSARARLGRWDKFVALFPDLPDLRVLDLGGTTQFWDNAPVRPKSVVVVNLLPQEDAARVEAVRGDACNPPKDIADRSFDLVVSNSVLEHVGGHMKRAEFAGVVQRSASRYWVQTPYRYFPLEPHWMFPCVQHLPFPARVRVTQLWRWGYMHSRIRATAVNHVNEVELVGIEQMKSYFSGAEIWREKMFGLVKSIVAVKA